MEAKNSAICSASMLIITSPFPVVVRCACAFERSRSSGPRLSTELASTLLVLDPLCEQCRQTEPPRSGLVIVVGPMSDSSVLTTHDRCASQRNWILKARGAIIGYTLRCRKL